MGYNIDLFKQKVIRAFQQNRSICSERCSPLKNTHSPLTDVPARDYKVHDIEYIAMTIIYDL